MDAKYFRAALPLAGIAAGVAIIAGTTLGAGPADHTGDPAVWGPPLEVLCSTPSDAAAAGYNVIEDPTTGVADGGLLEGTNAADAIFANGGDDIVYAGAGNDLICGGLATTTSSAEPATTRSSGRPTPTSSRVEATVTTSTAAPRSTNAMAAMVTTLRARCATPLRNHLRRGSCHSPHAVSEAPARGSRHDERGVAHGRASRGR